MAAVLACGERALLSHASAAWLWGIARASPIPVTVTVSTSQHPKGPMVIRHSRTIASEDRALLEGISVTALPRTLLDLAAILPRERLRRALERAEELRLFDLREVEALLAHCKGHPGGARLRRAITLCRPPPFSRSALERRFLELVARLGLPQPVSGFNAAGYEWTRTGPSTNSPLSWIPSRRMAAERRSSETGFATKTSGWPA